MKNTILEFKKILILLLIFNFIINISNICFADNYQYAGQAISDFLYNKIDAPDILKDSKYNDCITREEFSQLIVALYVKTLNINKEDIQLNPNMFVDTNSIDVQRAYSLGLMKGKNNDRFFPKDNMTREEISTIITRFLNIKKIDTTTSIAVLNDFLDKEDISTWAYSSISFCIEKDIIKGRVSSKNHDKKWIIPNETLVIQDVVTILDRMALKYNLIKQSSYIYVNGFYLPNDTKLKVIGGYSSDSTGICMEVKWNEIDNLDKLKNDLIYIINSKIDFNEIDKTKVNNIVDDIINLKEQTYEKTINIDEYNITVRSFSDLMLIYLD